MSKKITTVTSTVTNTNAAKNTPPPATGQKKPFVAANYVKPGVPEADVLVYKHAFDLFDTDQGGSVDTNCTTYS